MCNYYTFVPGRQVDTSIESLDSVGALFTAHCDSCNHYLEESVNHENALKAVEVHRDWHKWRTSRAYKSHYQPKCACYTAYFNSLSPEGQVAEDKRCQDNWDLVYEWGHSGDKIDRMRSDDLDYGLRNDPLPDDAKGVWMYIPE